MAQEGAPTLAEIASHNGIRESDLDKECPREIRISIANMIIEWKITGGHLGVPKEKLDAIEEKNDTEEECRVDLLNTWYQREGKRATYRQLMNAFLKQGNRDLADSLCAMIKFPVPQFKLRDTSSQQEMDEDLESHKRDEKVLSEKAEKLKEDFKQQRGKLDKLIADVQAKRKSADKKQKGLQQQSIETCPNQVKKPELKLASIQSELSKSGPQQVDLIEQIGEAENELKDSKTNMEKCLRSLEDKKKELKEKPKEEKEKKEKEKEKSEKSTFSGKAKTIIVTAAGVTAVGVVTGVTLGSAAAVVGAGATAIGIYRWLTGKEQSQDTGNNAAKGQDDNKDYEDLIKTCSDEIEEMKELVDECKKLLKQLKEIVHDMPLE